MSSGIEAGIIWCPCPSLSPGPLPFVWVSADCSAHLVVSPSNKRSRCFASPGRAEPTPPPLDSSSPVEFSLEMGPEWLSSPLLSSPHVFAIICSAVKEQWKQIPGGVYSILSDQCLERGSHFKAEGGFASFPPGLNTHGALPAHVPPQLRRWMITTSICIRPLIESLIISIDYPTLVPGLFVNRVDGNHGDSALGWLILQLWGWSKDCFSPWLMDYTNAYCFQRFIMCAFLAD